VLAVVAAVVVLPPAAPAPSPGRAGRGGEDAGPSYRGFGGELDTGVRAPRGDEVILSVRADSPALWRGDSYDRFDGRRWTHGGQMDQPHGDGADRGEPVGAAGGQLTVPGPTSPVPLEAPAARRVDEQVQVFTAERGGESLVFGANRPRTVLAPAGATWFAGAESLRLDEPLGRGGTYTVVSARPRVTDEILRSLDGAAYEAAAAARRGGADPFARYLAVPPSTTERTRRLAARVAGDAPTAYDRVRALEGWLGANTSYRLDVPPLPPGRDAVDQYLFEDRQGYCEQIASALAVMLRTLGVPTRLAVGVVPGGRDPTSGEWRVRERDAHAWVEVWWPEVGWQGFDPTAEVPLAPGEGNPGLLDRLAAVGPAGAAALALLGTLVAVAVAVPRRARRRAARSWPDRAVARLDRAGARAGRPRRPDETLLEYGAALDGSVLPDAGAPALARALAASVFAAADPAASPDGGARVDTERALAVLERSARRRPGRRRSRGSADR
jgi:transglutaminase-like putative cysteine protease